MCTFCPMCSAPYLLYDMSRTASIVLIISEALQEIYNNTVHNTYTYSNFYNIFTYCSIALISLIASSSSFSTAPVSDNIEAFPFAISHSASTVYEPYSEGSSVLSASGSRSSVLHNIASGLKRYNLDALNNDFIFADENALCQVSLKIKAKLFLVT